MNCQEFAQVLDEQELHQLPVAAREAAEAHLAACQDCRSDLEMHQRLAEMPIPALSAARIAGWRALTTSAAIVRERRHLPRNRYIAAGALVVAAAAAIMVGIRVEAPPERMVAVAPGPVAQPAPELPVPAEQVPSLVSPVQTVKVAAADPDTATPDPPAPSSFTLLVQPLQIETEDPLVQASAQQFYAALIDELRRVPGLVMIGPDPAIDPEARPTDFRMSAAARAATASSPGMQWEVMLRLHVFQGRRRVQPFRIYGSGEEAAATAPGIARMLRGMVFPASPSLKERLAAQFTDVTIPQEDRLRALEELTSMKVGDCPPTAAAQNCLRRAPLDVDQVHAALAMVSGPGEPLVRAGILRALSGQRHADLVQPLIEMAYRETSAEVRLEAVALLAEDFITDVAARSALELVARDDELLAVREVAARAVAEAAR